MRRKRISYCVFTFTLLSLFLLIGCSSDSKTLSIKPSSLDFENVSLGDFVEKELVFTNKYGKDIDINNLLFTGSPDYSISSATVTPFTMFKGAEIGIMIKFEPQSAGTLSATLEVQHTGSEKSKYVEMAGDGVPVARIELVETSYDFQKKIMNKQHTHEFEVENKGTAILSVDNLSFTGMGASAYQVTLGDAPFDVAQSGSHKFTVTFSPVAVSTYSAELLISHNAVNGDNPAKITIEGEGVDLDPRITLSVGTTWDFGSVAKTLPATLACEIENTGIDPLHVTSAVLTNSAEFTVDSLTDSGGSPLNFPQTVAVGDKILLYVKFEPTANVAYNDTLTIDHDGTNEVQPLSIPVSGTGRDEISKTYNYTGAVQTWLVPAGVSFIYVECYGAEGGLSNGVPGKGGKAAAKVPVTPGSTVNVYVGGKGDKAIAGWNGGGGTLRPTYPGGGGGASDIRIGGTDLADRKVVGAGGGGGGNHYTLTGTGGAGGGLTGGNGGPGSGQGGFGGTQTAGGAAGGANGATAGVFGIGGVGDNNYSGGGGGGWYGGGGGYYYAGGGGGSSYNDASGNTDKDTTEGVQTGDGEIIIKY